MPFIPSIPSRLSRLSLLFAVLAVLFLISTARPDSVYGQQSAVTAQALDHANLRSGPGLNYDTVTSITSGTPYPVIGRSAHYPWLLLNANATEGWVFADLVRVTGDIHSVPFVSDSVISNVPSPSPALSPSDAPFSSATPVISPTLSLTNALPTTLLATLTASPTVTFMPTALPAGVYAQASSAVNVRYGPGTDYPRVGTLVPGQQYLVTHRHTAFLWIEIAYNGVAGGHGWVYKDAVKISGNLQSVPATSATSFGYPTLTATPNMVVTAAPPWKLTPAATIAATPDAGSAQKLDQLGNRIFDYLLTSKFEPGTERQASVFVLDLHSGQAVSLNPGIAYSGMSLIKIPILLAVYRALDNPPTAEQAGWLGDMMICSDNLASDALLKLVGNGDVLAGARTVTANLDQLGLQNTFLAGPIAADPNATPAPLVTVKTQADQTSTDPDPFNQSTPAEMGYLLGAIYQCALDGSGPLMPTFGSQITVTECRQMILLLSSDKIGVMIEAGVPDGVQVAHKHGWVQEAVGDAGIVFTPGGDYVLTVSMAQRPVLIWPDEFPRVSEISRMVYNTYNPTQPLALIHPQNIPATCTLDNALLGELRASEMPPIH